MLYLCTHDVCLLLHYPVALSGPAERRGKEEENILAFYMYVALLANRPGRNQDSLNFFTSNSLMLSMIVHLNFCPCAGAKALLSAVAVSTH